MYGKKIHAKLVPQKKKILQISGLKKNSSTESFSPPLSPPPPLPSPAFRVISNGPSLNYVGVRNTLDERTTV